jgi:superfamily II DNA or RNA helicase
VKDALRVGFRVEAIGDGAYVGFELDGDGRFLLGDFTVTHNTEIGAALVSILPCEWAIFVASKSLVNEWVDRIAMRIGVTAGVIGDGMFSPGRVTVAMFQSVHRALAANDSRMKKWVESVQGFVVDECHLVAADTLWTVAMACRNAYYRFGNSATPFARGDRRGVLVVAAIGPTIYRIEQPTLVAQGTIAKGKVHLVHYALDEARAQELREMGASYGDAYESLVASNAHRDAAIVRVVRKAPKPAFVFVRLVDHGKALTDRLNDAGISAEFVWGEKHVKVREAAVRRLEHGDTDVIVCNVVFQAGVNVPTLASVVNVAGGKSHIAALQQTGRGSRRMDRDGQVVKDAFDVFDISDVNCGCKRPDPTQKGKSKWRHRACQWLERHARARRKAYLGEGYEVVEEDLA